MANKRMFSLSVVDTDEFLEMPLSSRLLYYELGMRADDDGFVANWKKILLFTGLKQDDLKVLIAKKFIIPFESGVIVIRHWRMNNYLQNDRTKPTIYQDELNQLVIENGVYCLNKNDFNEITLENENLTTKEKRKLAYEESELPYSFDYKIKNAFVGKTCPICGYKMENYVNAPHRPTIQHNLPLSKGGKHELGNISIICHKCNVSIKDNETEELNAKEVIEVWDNIQHCIQGCIHSIEENSIDKNRLDIRKEIHKEKKFKKPTLEEVETYCRERNNNIDAQHFIDFYDSKDWMIGKNKMKDWKACVRTWEAKEPHIPNWFDKEYKVKSMTKEEQKEIDDLLKSM